MQEAGGPATVGDFSRIKDVITRCNAMVSERPKASFTTKNLDQDLPRLLQSGSVEHHRDVLDRQNASAALAGKEISVLRCRQRSQKCAFPMPLARLVGGADQEFVVIAAWPPESSALRKRVHHRNGNMRF